MNSPKCWYSGLLPNTFFIVSDRSARDLSERFYIRFQDAQFLISELSTESIDGRLARDAWDFIQNPRPATLIDLMIEAILEDLMPAGNALPFFVFGGLAVGALIRKFGEHTTSNIYGALETMRERGIIEYPDPLGPTTRFRLTDYGSKLLRMLRDERSS